MEINFKSAPNKESPRYKMEFTLWPVVTQRKYLINTLAMQTSGSYVDSQDGVDSVQHINNEIVYPNLSLVRIADLIEEGAVIRLYDQSHSVEMFKILQEYLEKSNRNWNVTTSLFKPPIDRLKIYDRFAEALYAVAQHYGDVGQIGDGAERFMARFGAGKNSILSFVDAPTLSSQPKAGKSNYVSPLSANIGRQVGSSGGLSSWHSSHR